MKETKNILLVGGAGYLGSVLTNEFLKQGYNVKILDSLERGSVGIRRHKNNSNFELINANYMSNVLPLSLVDINTVIHLAGIVGDEVCAKEPDLATLVNVKGVQYLIEECNKSQIDNLFFLSSSSVYGSNSDVCNECTSTNPLSHYAQNKLDAENILKRESKISTLIFRLGTMYGWSSNMRFDLIVNRLVKDAVLKSKFNIFDGTQYRPFLHPKDLAFFFMLLFDQDLKKYNGEIYNLVSENLSMLELGQLIERVIPHSKMNLIPEKEDNRSYICRSFKAYNELGFSPLIRVREGVQEIEQKIIEAQELANVYKFLS